MTVNYTARRLDAEGDIELTIEGKRWRLLGRSGAETELRPVRDFLAEPGGLPVLLGAGQGHGLELLLREWPGPVAVIDCEEAIAEQTGHRARHVIQDFRQDSVPGDIARAPAHAQRVLWVDTQDPTEAVKALTRWQAAHGGLHLSAIPHPVYLRLRPDHYGPVRQALAASRKADFWSRARYTKFKTWPPRVLLISSRYFLMGEVAAGLERMGIPHRFIDLGSQELGCSAFVETLLGEVVSFRPDMVLTINHLGVDREGVLADLMNRLELPLASWFVDNPHLILNRYKGLAGPLTAIFTWDSDNVPSLKAEGYEHVFYLPLGTDPYRFRPGLPVRPDLRCDVGFVGNSMLAKVAHRLKLSRPPRRLLIDYPKLAAGFAASDARSVIDYLLAAHPQHHALYAALTTVERRLSFETLLTWEATRQYRLACVRATLGFGPLIVGDRHWPKVLGATDAARCRFHPELSYYDELPHFYQGCTINFNATSKQMKGAVNQRVFDVPACGGFVLSDHREQLEQLFELGTEAIVYNDPAEIPELTAYYLHNDSARLKVVEAARRRVLEGHTYDHRLRELLESMRRLFG